MSHSPSRADAPRQPSWQNRTGSRANGLLSPAVNLGRVRDAHDLGDQVVAGTEGKIVMQVFVAVDVDLCRQRNVIALEKYLDGARIAGVPEGD